MAVSPPALRGEQLQAVLLRVLAEQPQAMTTAALRRRAQEVVPGGVPLVNEVVYRALLTLRRRGGVTHHRPGGRHDTWTVTTTGNEHRAGPAPGPAN